MFAHPVGFFKAGWMLAAVIVLLALAGCGGEGSEEGAGTSAEAESTTGGPDQESAGSGAAEGDTSEADPEDLEVIDEWSASLSEGDVETAASYFATPSIAKNGPVLIEIRSQADAVEFNRTLPCGAEVISAQTAGDFTTATFRLSERPGGGCGPGAGGSASTSFVIEDGEIVEWRRVGEGSPQDGGSASPA